MVSLFRRGNADNQHEQLSALLLRRMDFLEYDRLIAFESVVTEHDTRMENLAHRVNLLEEAATRNSQRVSAGPEGSLTAEAAAGAPLWTEEGNNSLPTPAPALGITPLHTLNRLEAEIVALTEPDNQYGSGAPSGAPGATGPSTDLLTFTPPTTPRTQQSPMPSQTEPQSEPNTSALQLNARQADEPVWGRNFRLSEARR